MSPPPPTTPAPTVEPVPKSSVQKASPSNCKR
jgi:hypothetical protein